VLLALLAIGTGVPRTMAMPQHTSAPVTTAGVVTQSAVASAPQIALEHFAFGPTALTVSVGTMVTWVNHDDDLHTVTSATGLFTSPGLDSGDGFTYRFTAPGTYTYFCALHPHMTGTIIVL
jgi:plastocyanin